MERATLRPGHGTPALDDGSLAPDEGLATPGDGSLSGAVASITERASFGRPASRDAARHSANRPGARARGPASLRTADEGRAKSGGADAAGALDALEALLARAVGSPGSEIAPPTIGRAMRHAVFPGGARVRPRLALAVAASFGSSGTGASRGEDGSPASEGSPASDHDPALGFAAALELMHCASLVHDDMPCFDDAATRRGRPSVHAAFGEPIALLAGDGLIVAAYDVLARSASSHPGRLPALIGVLSDAVGAVRGIIAGQAWEAEPDIPLEPYHRAKTAALFVGATTGGAIAAGREPGPWRALGEGLGDAYQIADDLRDAVLDETALGKPAGQDDRHGRPSAVAEHGIDGALARLREATDRAIGSIPEVPGRGRLEGLVRGEARRLVPPALA